jgi:hypothetical protein
LGNESPSGFTAEQPILRQQPQSGFIHLRRWTILYKTRSEL